MVKCVVGYVMSENTCLRILIGVWGYPYAEIVFKIRYGLVNIILNLPLSPASPFLLKRFHDR